MTMAPCVFGLGNRGRGDDAAGPMLCDRLAGRFGGAAIDGGVAPENHLERVVAAASGVVLVVDAIDFGGTPGETRVLDSGALIGAGVSTHACSPAMLDAYLGARSADGTHVVWLGIQPGSATEVTAAVRRSVEELAQQLCRQWPREDET